LNRVVGKIESVETAEVEASSEEKNETEDEEDDHSRRKRELHQKTFEYAANRTLFLNCTSSMWKCKTLTCNSGPMFKENDLALIILKLEIDFKMLSMSLY